MDKFLESSNLPRLNEDAIDSLNNVDTSAKIVSNKKSPKKRSPGPGGFSSEF